MNRVYLVHRTRRADIDMPEIFPDGRHLLYESDDQVDTLVRATGFASISHRVKEINRGSRGSTRARDQVKAEPKSLDSNVDRGTS